MPTRGCYERRLGHFPNAVDSPYIWLVLRRGVSDQNPLDLVGLWLVRAWEFVGGRGLYQGTDRDCARVGRGWIAGLSKRLSLGHDLFGRCVADSLDARVPRSRTKDSPQVFALALFRVLGQKACGSGPVSSTVRGRFRDVTKPGGREEGLSHRYRGGSAAPTARGA